MHVQLYLDASSVFRIGHAVSSSYNWLVSLIHPT